MTKNKDNFDEKLVSKIRYKVLYRNRQSISYIQRKMMISYNKACSIMETITQSKTKVSSYKYRKFISKYKKNQRFDVHVKHLTKHR